MAVHLVMARAGAHAALAGDLEAVGAEAAQVLLDPVEGVSVASIALCVGERMAIGRREGGRASWWVLEDSFPLSPPHGLWTSPGLFQPDGDGSVPGAVDVGALWERLTAGGDPAVWAERLASVVRLMREGDGPLSLVVEAPHEALEAAGILLAVVLGPHLTVSIGHPAPDPTVVRLSIGPEVAGFPEVPGSLPGPGDDPVARFVRERLRSQPDALLVEGGLTEAHVRSILEAEAVPSDGSEVADALLAGATVDDALLERLVEATVTHGDAAPWEALVKRPSAVREQAVTALLRRAGEVTPNRALLDAFMRVYPRGAALAPLCGALLDWMRRAEIPSVVGGHLETALTEWPQEAGRANRVSLWMEAVRILVQGGHHREAAEAVSGPVALRMIDEGAGAAVALLWGTLDPEVRNPLRLSQITKALAKHPRGDHAAGILLRSLQPEALDVFVRAWIRHRGKSALLPEDEVLRLAVDGDALVGWLAAAREHRGLRAIRQALGGVLGEDGDTRWVTVHEVLSVGMEPGAALRLAGELPGADVLEPIARSLLVDALAEARFPDAQLAAASIRFASLCDDLLWAWVGVACAAPGAHPDDVIDGTVVALCEDPPEVDERPICRAVARQLGGGGTWTALDHARWIVRLALAPQESGLAEELLEALLEGLVQRFDAAPHLAGVVGEMVQLGGDHPALIGLLRRWLPRAWHARMPAAFVEAVRVRGIPADVEPLWSALVDADR